jgi:hypothetical protein
MRQYIGFPLGIADASVIAVAERLEADEVASERGMLGQYQDGPWLL